MDRNYVEKVLSQNLEKMTIGELVDYLCFLNHNQFYFHYELGGFPFKRKFYEVAAFIIGKYGVVDADGRAS